MSNSFLWCEERHWDGNPRSQYFLPCSLSLGVGIFLFRALPLSGFASPFLWLDVPSHSLDHFCTIFSRSPLFLPGVFPDHMGEFLLELLPCLSFESRLSFEEPPRFLFHLLETFFIFGACFPVVSTSPKLLTLLSCHIEASSFPVALAKKLSVSSIRDNASWARVVDRGRLPQNPLARSKKPLPVGRSGLANGEWCINSA